MDTVPSLTISPVLREAAELKIDELNRGKQAFKRRYLFGAGGLPEIDSFTRVKSLLDDIAELKPELNTDDDLETVARYVRQGIEDGSVSNSKLLQIEEQIRSKLAKHLNRLELSSLHMDLLMEAMDAAESTASLATKLESVDLDDDDFEVVQNDLDEVLEKFEKETFTTKDINVKVTETYLSSLLSSSEDAPDLDEVRNDLHTYGDKMMVNGIDIDQDFLMACIVELLKSGLIDEDKKKTIESYLQSPIALRELVATLNMKSVRHWEYRNINAGLAVTARKNGEGQYQIAIEESIIDLLFLHCIGIGWATKLKSCLEDLFRGCVPTGLSVDENKKREYFLGYQPIKIPVASMTVCSLCHPHYQLSPMPPPPPMPFDMPPPPPPPCNFLPIRKKSKAKRKSTWSPYPPPPPPRDNMGTTRHNQYTREYFMSRLPIQDGCTPKTTPSEEVQANLIKTLVIERKLREAFDGQAWIGSAHFKALASSLPHQTTLTVLKFLGVPDAFIEFFKRFLSVKVNIGSAVHGAPGRILARARGVPEGHALEVFFTESIMFFLELAVHQKTGSYIYRLKDSCYFVGNCEQHRAYEDQVSEFAHAMGLNVTCDMRHSIGLLGIDTRGVVIEEYKVTSYARGIKKQLDACTTVLDWVRVWNGTVGTYAAHLFGPLADVLGKAHLVAVKRAYNLIFGIVFEGSNLTSYVKQLLKTHLQTPLDDPPCSLEAFIYLPQAYGGLGVKNPFITISLARNLCDKPDAKIAEYLSNEEKYYKRAAENYALLSPEAYPSKIEALFANEKPRVDAALGEGRDLTVFMTKEELTVHRERAVYPHLSPPPYPASYMPMIVPDLTKLYADLLSEPKDDISCSDKIGDDVRRLSDKDDMKSWARLSGEDKWVLQLYGDECLERYGGLEIWCGEVVPQEVLKVVRGALWDESDDGSSVSDMTEP
jgi:hypothetical protein